MTLFRRRKTRWQRVADRVVGAGTNRKQLAKRAAGVAGGTVGLLGASAATSSLRHRQR